MKGYQAPGSSTESGDGMTGRSARRTRPAATRESRLYSAAGRTARRQRLGAVPSAECLYLYQSLVSLAQGVMIRTRREPKFTSRAVSTSTPMTRPRPYVSWVT
jgi:hypothetical protein